MEVAGAMRRGSGAVNAGETKPAQSSVSFGDSRVGRQAHLVVERGPERLLQQLGGRDGVRMRSAQRFGNYLVYDTEPHQVRGREFEGV
ncbi:MAG: hypothetical protein OSB03_16400, partial [Vicinamibacterales bacterium]|nr:hypothetical protein [Vicinamibacterales bacterium]